MKTYFFPYSDDLMPINLFEIGWPCGCKSLAHMEVRKGLGWRVVESDVCREHQATWVAMRSA